MRTQYHFGASFLVGVLAIFLYRDPFLLLYAVLLGTLIDFDHFLLARWKSGGWDATKRVLESPRVLIEGGHIFDEDETHSVRVYVTLHTVEALVLTAIAFTVSDTLGGTTAMVLSLHVLMDIYDEI